MKSINNTIELDGIDKQIIRALMQNARTPILEIAKRIGKLWFNPRLKGYN